MKDSSSNSPAISQKASQLIVDNLLTTLKRMESNITDSISDLLDTRLEGMDEVVVELIRCKTENENLKNQIENNQAKSQAEFRVFFFLLFSNNFQSRCNSPSL